MMSTKVTTEQIKTLREQTGAGMMSCKEALVENEGNLEKATEYLRKKGLASAEKKQARTAKEGLISSYIHTGNKLGVLLELNCETDFVARRPEFQQLAHDVALQIAASPTVKYISLEDIPQELKQKEISIEFEKEDIQDKILDIKEKIAKNRAEKTLKSLALLEQPFIKNPVLNIDELIKQNISLVGENIKIARFTRFILGETMLVESIS